MTKAKKRNPQIVDGDKRQSEEETIRKEGNHVAIGNHFVTKSSERGEDMINLRNKLRKKSSLRRFLHLWKNRESTWRAVEGRKKKKKNEVLNLFSWINVYTFAPSHIDLCAPKTFLYTAYCTLLTAHTSVVPS